MLAQPIGGPNNAYRLTHLGAYSYYSGPKCLSQARDSPSGVAVRLLQSSEFRVKFSQNDKPTRKALKEPLPMGWRAGQKRRLPLGHNDRAPT